MGAEGESSVSRGGDEEVNVNIRCSNGSKFFVKASLESTVAEFKGLLAQNCDVPAQQQRLIYKGRILKDDQTLASYGLQADHAVHMVRGAAPASTPPSAAPVNTGTNGVAEDGGGPNKGGAGVAAVGASLFPGLGLSVFNGAEASGLFGAGLPEFEQVQPQLTQNPNMMREIMNMPAIQSLMNNPEIMRSLIMSNPQMREIIERNPELAHILNDPSILQQTMEAARNPELMREMMRNTDRAMSNIESSPEGFNMLRRMYENVQEPFLNASTMGCSAATDTGSNPFTALVENQAGSQTRYGSNSSSAGPQMTTGSTVPNANPLPNPWSNTGGSQTNNATRTNLIGNATLPSIAGLESMGMPNISTLNQLMQNPVAPQTMQLPDPQLMDHMFNLNSQLRVMLDMNPQLREMMQNPETLRELIPPSTMQRMMALQQLSQQNRQQYSTQEGSQLGQTTGPPEELYATQLSQLQEMGFFDTQENIRALQATAGNVQAAIERLLGNIGQ